LRFRGTCYRAHDPRWSFKPLSGMGSAIYGGRFNPKGVPALYLSLTIAGAIKEANQGFAFKIEPCVLCSCDVDCAKIADLRTDAGRNRHGATFKEMACAWFLEAARGAEPPSWRIANRLMAMGHAGILVPSFAPGAGPDDHNLVLWRWGARRPHKIRVYDPSGRLPKNQLSWK
jgi:RES domain-containing protein